MIPLGVVQSQTSGGGGPTPGVYHITIDMNSSQVVLLDVFTNLYGAPLAGDEVYFTINPLVVLNGQKALRTGVWPVDVFVQLTNNSQNIEASGAHGTDGLDGGTPTTPSRGGTAFLAESLVTVDNTFGRFVHGGFGGRGSEGDELGSEFAGGGGGAGNPPGGGGFGSAGESSDGDPGTATEGGAGGFVPDPGFGSGGSGGDLGQLGGGTSGPPGYSVDGYSLITWINTGVLIGPTNG